MQPLVSIIIPVYNGSNYLAEAIDSALAQTYKNIEIIVVNDGSKDNGATEKVALTYGDKIRYFKKENGGVSSALNFGISKMEGEYFSWLSHDDIYLPTKIETQVNKLETEKDIVLCYGSLMDKDCNPISHHTKTMNAVLDGRELFRFYLKDYGLNGLGFLIPKQAFEKAGEFDESLRYLQDLDLWLRMCWFDYRFICHEDLLVVSRMHIAQTTNLLKDVYKTDSLNMGKKHVSLLKEVDVKGRKELLICYLLFFSRGMNKAARDIVKAQLKEMKAYTVGVALKSKKFACIGYAKKYLRQIRDFIYKRKNIRG